MCMFVCCYECVRVCVTDNLDTFDSIVELIQLDEVWTNA